MPKRIVPLSDAQVRTAKPKEREYKLADGQGLYLLVTPTGGKLWRMKYSYARKEKTLAFGSYPAVALSDARKRREDAKKLLANGVDPSEVKKAQQAARAEAAANSFEVVSLEWHGKQSQWSDSHRDKVLQALKRDVFPWIGVRPVSEVKPADLLVVLRRIEGRGALETAHRVRSYCSKVFRYAISTARAERNPAADLVGALSQPEKRHFASIVEPKEIAPLLKMLDGYSGTFVVKCALRLAPLLFLRPGELRQTEWSEVDLEKAEIKIPVSRMKLPKSEKILHKKEFHYVPLSRQAVGILTELKALTGNSRYVFTSGRSFHRCMSENAVNAALRRMGIDTQEEICGHGFRAMARTVLAEQLGWNETFMELQLAHAVKGPHGRAYNRTSFLAERRRMMQTWADYLDCLKSDTPFSMAGESSITSVPPSNELDIDAMVDALTNNRLDDVPPIVAAIYEAVRKLPTAQGNVKVRKKPGPKSDSVQGLARQERDSDVIKTYLEKLAEGEMKRGAIEEYIAKEKGMCIQSVQKVLTKMRKTQHPFVQYTLDLYQDMAIKLLFDTYQESRQGFDRAFSDLGDTLNEQGIRYPQDELRRVVNSNIDYSDLAACKSDLEVIVLVGSALSVQSQMST